MHVHVKTHECCCQVCSADILNLNLWNCIRTQASAFTWMHMSYWWLLARLWYYISRVGNWLDNFCKSSVWIEYVEALSRCGGRLLMLLQFLSSFQLYFHICFFVPTLCALDCVSGALIWLCVFCHRNQGTELIMNTSSCGFQILSFCKEQVLYCEGIQSGSKMTSFPSRDLKDLWRSILLFHTKLNWIREILRIGAFGNLQQSQTSQNGSRRECCTDIKACGASCVSKLELHLEKGAAALSWFELPTQHFRVACSGILISIQVSAA